MYKFNYHKLLFTLSVQDLPFSTRNMRRLIFQPYSQLHLKVTIPIPEMEIFL